MKRFLLLTIGLAILCGCQDRNYTLLGYRIGSNFDPSIKTVSVQLFRNVSEQTSPNRNLEADLAEAIVREINSRPGLRVVSDPDAADSVLTGTINSVNKLILNRNQQNQWRDGEVLISTSIVWKSRDGRVLSNRSRSTPSTPIVPPFDPTLPPTPIVVNPEAPVPVILVANGRLVPELGESNATAQQMAIRQLARQIVNLMEEPW